MARAAIAAVRDTAGHTLWIDRCGREQTQARWFNTSAFATPVLQYGNFGKNVLSTASVQQIDSAAIPATYT